MVQRTPLGFPYVEGTDTLITYPTTSQELATALDAAITEGPSGGGIGSFNTTSLPNGAQTKLALAQTYLNGLTLAANQLTVQKEGWYSVSARVGLSGSVGEARAFMSANIGGRDFRAAATRSDTLLSVTAMARCVVGDKIYCDALQTSGAVLTANSGGHWFVKYLGNE
jgi:hypothetical protein